MTKAKPTPSPAPRLTLASRYLASSTVTQVRPEEDIRQMIYKTATTGPSEEHDSEVLEGAGALDGLPRLQVVKRRRYVRDLPGSYFKSFS